MEPRVSVVIPTFNRRAVLIESIASVQRQTFPELEILVCDDGSGDGSREAVAALAASDARIRWIEGAHCGLPGTVRNRGIRAARGEWIAFQDSDDLWVPEKLERQLAAARRDPPAAVVYSHAAALMPDGRRVRMTPFRVRREGRVFETFLRYSLVHTPTLLVRRELLERSGGFDETMQLRVAEDYELVLRLAAAEPFRFVPEDLALCRAQGDSVSADLLAGLDQFERVLESIVARYAVPGPLARDALSRIDLRRYKHRLLRGHPRRERLRDLRRYKHRLLRGHPRRERLRDLRAALARHPGSLLGRALQLAEALRAGALLRRVLTAQARSAA